ncbi:TetR/AcrR family transcriptional regulator [Amycolatopsis sp. FDAARGOS 1241]|uniref:TetR/AcrR family transcriptional regulator n=1 Tax=Amycolatopsis sp. FDAARGOS 1241 TaxID=2778070 RepID=UPI001951AA45|nr:TetR/AcrR family transcriptional regulator [Amycolatopsis sp. FDAARGOS 1241]QRP47816.1 TetR/AcrR family transcriptional regulator [Amycolatopsis sp. FDAARGOS 1241]
MAEVSARRPPSGRPRTHGVDDAVLKATIRRLIEDGYRGMSVAKVAADAGTSRPTVYLRWPSKQALVVAAVRWTFEQPLTTLPDDGAGLPPKERLLHLLRTIEPAEDREHRQLYTTLLAESNRVPELLQLLEEHVVQPRARAVAELLEAMQRRGEIRPDVNTEHAAMMIYGVRFVDSLYLVRAATDRDRESVKLLWPSLTYGLA